MYFVRDDRFALFGFIVKLMVCSGAVTLTPLFSRLVDKFIHALLTLNYLVKGLLSEFCPRLCRYKGQPSPR